ncbi:MAG: PQQ-binding-like beta-propeller repeat protein [Polyangiaceae bacterium]|nr:PQQ-binding-like beta-propeller repeat protein [Polyangiaceae bacterium]
MQKWVASVAGTDLLAWADGTLSTWYHHIQPGSGITTNFAFQAPLNYPGAGQVSVWIDATGKSRLIFSVRESTTAHVQSGPLPVSWSSATHGCCDFGSRPLALDTANGFGYYQGYRLDLTTGAHLSTIALIPGNELFQAVVGGNTVYYATKNQLSKANWTSATIEWAKPIASSNAAVWAVADPSDGVVVASAAGPLGRVKSDGAFAWSVSGVKAAIPPVLGSNGLVYVGTADPELGAYRASDGVKQWSIPLPSVPMDLAVAGDHLVYVLLGGSGQLLGIDPSVHEAVFKWTGIPGQGKAMLLRGGTMFVLGTSSGLSKVVAIPVPSASLDSKSPWPVLFHDNQRSCDRNGSLAF